MQYREGTQASEGGEAASVIGMKAGNTGIRAAIEHAGGFEAGRVGYGLGKVAECWNGLAD